MMAGVSDGGILPPQFFYYADLDCQARPMCTLIMLKVKGCAKLSAARRDGGTVGECLKCWMG